MLPDKFPLLFIGTLAQPNTAHTPNAECQMRKKQFPLSLWSNSTQVWTWISKPGQTYMCIPSAWVEINGCTVYYTTLNLHAFSLTRSHGIFTDENFSGTVYKEILRKFFNSEDINLYRPC